MCMECRAEPSKQAKTENTRRDGQAETVDKTLNAETTVSDALIQVCSLKRSAYLQILQWAVFILYFLNSLYQEFSLFFPSFFFSSCM